MKFIPTAIPDLVIIEPTVYTDERGWFMESFNEPKFHQGLKELGLPIPRPFVQDNHSCSHKGVLRGLHYQRAPHAQGKLVRVVRGAVWDVAVDIRPGSGTYGKWVGVDLSESNKRQLWIPEGFAHGFLTLEDHTEFLYKSTDVYVKEAEGAILWSDPKLAISWPLSRTGGQASAAPKDAAAAPWSSTPHH
jgi:dTDP-4-dehydrorhamnose 3,5-epimerase